MKERIIAKLEITEEQYNRAYDRLLDVLGYVVCSWTEEHLAVEIKKIVDGL